MNYYERHLAENITANGDYPSTGYIRLQGMNAIAFYGTPDGVTLQFVFFTEDSNGNMNELPVPADMDFQTLTAVPEPDIFRFSPDLPCRIRASVAGASTDMSVNAHEVDPGSRPG